MTESTWGGPDPDLWERYSRACQAPVIMGLGLDGVAAMNERVIAAGTFDELSAADQGLIRDAELQISSGLSPTLQQPEDWTAGSDWTAEDEALDGGSSADSLPDPGEGDWIGL